MIDLAASRRFIVAEDTRPAFARHARLRQDRVRDRVVSLAPERVYEVDAIGVAVLKLCDGERTLRGIVAELASRYAAPAERIGRDVAALLQGLADKRVLRDGPDRFAAPAPSAPASSYPRFEGGPAGLLAELTHRCPLQCPYCSNPLELERANAEMSAETWGDIFRQAAAMGVLQLHLSGGEPTARRDLEFIVKHAVEAGLYTNLVTAGVLLTREALARLADIGLDHVQVSVQDIVPENADRISGYKGGVARKRDVARWTREFGLGLTINAPIHRGNIDHLPEIIAFAVEMEAQRIEVAHIQYYAWADRNRAALIPTRDEFLATAEIVESARRRWEGVLDFDFVVPDHYATLPKACMGGWAKSILMVTPSGRVLPCHAAQTLPGLRFDNARERPLADIWRAGAAFQAFRGVAWMKEPCRSCDRREIDFGGCRCQAFAITGDAAAADPACHLSSAHARFSSRADTESRADPPTFVYRRMSGPGAEA